jgi:isopropylmalate/homocitrate/citramalate synthase
MSAPATVTVCEVGPRDGLQNEPETQPAAVRAELVDRLAATGLARVEAASFVRPDVVPQMADAEEVVARLTPRDGTSYAGLVLNERGWERLSATALDRVTCSLGVTESFNRENAGASLEQATRQVEAIVAASDRPVTLTLSVAFGCPFEGAVDPGAVAELAARFAGDAEVSLADTIGVATPAQVGALVARTRAVGFHGHNTRNTGYANAVAALAAGARVLDASVGGIGGCPFSPGSTGNVATEDLVYLLEGDGVATGVDLDALVKVACWVETLLAGPLPGLVHHAARWPLRR